MATTKNPKLDHVIRVSREDALKLAQSTGNRQLLALLRKAEAELVQRLSQAQGLKGPGKDSFTAYQNDLVLRQVRDVIRNLNQGMSKILLSQGVKAADLATQNLAAYMRKANQQFKGLGNVPLAIEEAGMFLKAKAGVESSILARLASSGENVPGAAPIPDKAKPGVLARYGNIVISHFEEELANGLITRKPWDEVKASLIAKSPFLQQAPAHWATRIVVTETLGAYARSTQEALTVANDSLGDMVKILAATFDNRTGWDSYSVHGQIRRVHEPFAWKDGFYMTPPNRPFDREVIVPHRISWPIPDYLRPKTDAQVSARYFQQRKSGSPGVRPKMSTVPYELFGKELTK